MYVCVCKLLYVGAQFQIVLGGVAAPPTPYPMKFKPYLELTKLIPSAKIPLAEGMSFVQTILGDLSLNPRISFHIFQKIIAYAFHWTKWLKKTKFFKTHLLMQRNLI